ncbi:MAG: hypothetical protein JWM95_1280 [Gemmatimonadetes bacterium]|nr:hypothetical protein [Gemmatimonadota bacterium]
MFKSFVVVTLVSCTFACGSSSESRKAESQDGTPGTLAAGTRVDASIQGALSSRTGKVGDSTQAIVSRNVIDGSGAIAIPAGSTVTLTVAQLNASADPASPDGTLSLVASSITVNARTYPLGVPIKEVPHHMEWRDGAVPPAGTPGIRDVIVSAGTSIGLMLATPLKVTPK